MLFLRLRKVFIFDMKIIMLLFNKTSAYFFICKFINIIIFVFIVKLPSNDLIVIIIILNI